MTALNAMHAALSNLGDAHFAVTLLWSALALARHRRRPLVIGSGEAEWIGWPG